MILKGRPLQYFATSIGLLNMFGSGFHLAWSSPFLPVLERDPTVNITKDEGSWIATTYLIASPIGTVVTSLILDKVGRKISLLLSAVPYLMSWIIIASTQRLGFLVLARLLGGIADGVIYTVLPIYIGEVADPPIRGFLISFMGILSIVAALFINVMGYYMSITSSAIVCAVPPVIVLIFFPFMPETPNYYIVKENVKKAREVLCHIRGREVGEEEIKELVEVNEEGLKKTNILDLFRLASNRKGLFVFMGTMAAQQFSGIVPIMFYTQTIFEEAAEHFPVIASTSLLYIVLIAFSVISALIVDKLGRRPLLITSILCCCLAQLLEGVNLCIKHKAGVDNVGFSWMTIGDFMFLIIGYSIGLLAIPTVLEGELFPLNIKPAAVCFCNVYYAAIATAVSKLFQFTNDQYGLYVPFFVFSAFCCLALIYAIIFVPETKSKTLEQIQIDLKAVKGKSESQDKVVSAESITRL